MPVPEQQRHVRQVAKPHFLSGRQRAVVGDDGLDALVEDRDGVDERLVEGRPREHQVERRVPQVLLTIVRAVHVADLERHVRMLLRELDSQPVDHVPQSPPDADANPALLAARHLTRDLAELGAGRVERPRLLEQPLAVVGQRHALAMANEERQTELFLELMNMAAERRLGNVESFGGLGHAESVGHGNECLYVPKVHGGGILYQIRMS